MSDPYLTRHTLLYRAKLKDDHKAWTEFTEAYRPFIYHVLHRLNVGPNHFDDVVQEVMLRLWEKLGTYDSEKGKFRTWLSTVIRNLVFNFWDKQKRESQNKQNWIENETVVSESSSVSKPDIDRMIEREWKMHISKLALQNISKLFSGHAIRVFEMSLEGADPDEISSALGIKRESVKVLKSRVRRRYVEEVKQLIREFEEL